MDPRKQGAHASAAKRCVLYSPKHGCHGRMNGYQVSRPRKPLVNFLSLCFAGLSNQKGTLLAAPVTFNSPVRVYNISYNILYNRYLATYVAT